MVDTNLDTGGGAYIGGDAQAGGDIVGRDQFITNVYKTSPPPLSSAEAKDVRDLGILLAKVRQFWLYGVLEKSVQNTALIQLGKETQVEAIAHAWEQVLELPQQNRQTLPPDRKMGQIFEDMNRSLLILGEPGSGKTTTMLQLARDLISQVEQDQTFSQPVPVVFHLSTWTDKWPFMDWLVEELATKYQIPRKVGYRWFADARLLPLLDGLNEVEPKYRAACVQAINDFGEEYGLAGMVVCCRLLEYTQLPVRLKLNGAIRLQPLLLEQVYDYLETSGPAFEGLRKTLQQDEAFRELARSPLMLSIMVMVYQDRSELALPDTDRQTPEARRRHLFETYIERMLSRKGQREKPYPDGQTRTVLSWLANQMIQNHQAEFLLEQIQTSWLPIRLQRWHRTISFALSTCIPFALVVGIGRGIFLRPSVGWTFGILAGLAVVVMIGFLIHQTPRVIGGIIVGGAFGVAFGVTFGLNYNLVTGLLSGLVFSAAAGVIFVLLKRAIASSRARLNWETVDLVETVRWSWYRAAIGLSIGLLAGMAVGIVVGQVVWPPLMIWFCSMFSVSGSLIAALFSGLSPGVVEQRVMPNQGIHRSLYQAVVIGSLVALSIGVPISAISNEIWTALPGRIDGPGVSLVAGLSIGSSIGILFGMISSLFFGGLAVIQHYMLRALLWYNGDIPWRFPQFLDYAADRVFLQQVGGGYRFIHRPFLEHFAAMTDSDKDVQAARDEFGDSIAKGQPE